MSYWDFITDLCVGSGFIVYIRTPQTKIVPLPGGLVDATPPAEIVISTARTYYPGQDNEIRKFAYGYNVERLEITRDYNGKTLPTAVAVSATEDETGNIRTEQYPEPVPTSKKKKGKVNNRATPDVVGVGDREETDRFLIQDRIPAFSISKTLKRYAQSIYEQLYRAEQHITVETKALSALPSNWGDPNVADMLKLRPADAVEIEVVPLDLDTLVGVTTIGSFQETDPVTRSEFLLKLGMDPVLVQQIIAAEFHPQIQKVFRVQNVDVSFDADTGYQFTVDAMNFLDVSAEGANI
jgi:hypothetical protein